MEQPLHQALEDPQGNADPKLKAAAPESPSMGHNGLHFSRLVIHRQLLVGLG